MISNNELLQATLQQIKRTAERHKDNFKLWPEEYVHTFLSIYASDYLMKSHGLGWIDAINMTAAALKKYTETMNNAA